MAVVNIDTNEEEQLRMVSPGGATGLNLREDERMYFGGVPKTGKYRCVHSDVFDEFFLYLILHLLSEAEDEFNFFTCFLRSEVVLKRFSGCMKDIEVSRTPYNLLSSPDYTGLTKGCSIEVQQHSTFLPLLSSL